ncbi:pirin family protein [bacterium]|nr:pirin family protein [bacterium]
MNTRLVAKLIRASAVSEGAGVTVHRTIGTSALRNFDPFLMLDHFGSDNPNEYISGFPDHPHRGFITFTYMLDGKMLHQDSMGNRGELRSGGAQWMKAASGVIHSEMPQQSQGLMRGFQLWINLPAKEKMSPPEYQEFSPEAVPQITIPGGHARVLAGLFQGQSGVIQDPNTQAIYLDVSLSAEQKFQYNIPSTHNAFIYVFEGTAELNETQLPTHSLAVLSTGEHLTLKTNSTGARFILVAGKPLGEPIVQYGPFVMNTREEIEQAFSDYQTGRLVRSKAEMTGR